MRSDNQFRAAHMYFSSDYQRQVLLLNSNVVIQLSDVLLLSVSVVGKDSDD